jgi:hypothetical protein
LPVTGAILSKFSWTEEPGRVITITITRCGRICMGARKIHVSTVFAGQNVGVKQVADRVWLVSFMDYDLGFFDDQTGLLQDLQEFLLKIQSRCTPYVSGAEEDSLRGGPCVRFVSLW